MRRIQFLAVALAALATAFAWPTPLRAASSLDRTFGTPELGASARQRALGGAGTVLDHGAFALIDNPAALALATGSSAQLTGVVQRASENRFVPLFDTFDSFVDETAIAVNDHVYASVNGGVVLVRPEFYGTVVSIGRFARYDPRYDYFDERRSTATTDQIVAERYIRTRGTLDALVVGAARALPYGTTVGLALHRYAGEINSRDALVPRDLTVTARVLESRRSLRGMSLGLGATGRLNERVTLGLAWESGARVVDDFTDWVDGAQVSGQLSSRNAYLPPRVVAGGAYRPRNALRSTFATDLIWTGWSSVTDAVAPTRRPTDTWDVRFGLEHVYLDGLPGRIGFRYERSPVLVGADRVWFTFGAGWLVPAYAVDAALEVGKRTSRQEPVWPRVEQGSAVGTGQDRVEDTLVRLTFGIDLRF